MHAQDQSLMKITDSERGESPIRNNPSALAVLVLIATILAASAIGILTWAIGWQVLLIFGAALVIFFVATFALDAVRGTHKAR